MVKIIFIIKFEFQFFNVVKDNKRKFLTCIENFHSISHHLCKFTNKTKKEQVANLILIFYSSLIHKSHATNTAVDIRMHSKKQNSCHYVKAFSLFSVPFLFHFIISLHADIARRLFLTFCSLLNKSVAIWNWKKNSFICSNYFFSLLCCFIFLVENIMSMRNEIDMNARRRVWVK
jgi:hypothetical protein